MSRSVAVVFTLGAQEEAVQAVVLADRVDAVPAPGEHFVDVTLVSDVEDEAIRWRVEHAMHGECELHHTQIWAQVAACLAEGFDEGLADPFSKIGQFLERQRFEIGRAGDGRQLGGIHRLKKSYFRAFRGGWLATAVLRTVFFRYLSRLVRLNNVVIE